MQKVEVFERALSNTNGDDLAKLLWLTVNSREAVFYPSSCVIHDVNSSDRSGLIAALTTRARSL